MLNDTFPLLGGLLLGVTLLASAAAGWSLRRSSRRVGQSEGVPGGGVAALLLVVAAVAAATGAAALSDGTWGIGGWWPFAAGLAAACLPLAATGLLRRPPG